MSRSSSRPGGQFATLPTEIIRNVATSLKCTDAIALSLTCRNAYVAVNDWPVFEGIIRASEKRRIRFILEERDNLPAWTVPECAYISSSVCKTDVYKRYALANQRAAEMVFSNRFREITDFGKWVPMLLLSDRMLLELFPSVLINRCLRQDLENTAACQ